MKFCLLGLHHWTYTSDCSGATHWFQRKCECGKTESLGHRRCGVSCSTFTESIKNLSVGEQKESIQRAKERTMRRINQTRELSKMFSEIHRPAF